MLAEAGYRLRSNPRQFVVEDPDNDVELSYLRPLDIASKRRPWHHRCRYHRS